MTPEDLARRIAHIQQWIQREGEMIIGYDADSQEMKRPHINSQFINEPNVSASEQVMAIFCFGEDDFMVNREFVEWLDSLEGDDHDGENTCKFFPDC